MRSRSLVTAMVVSLTACVLAATGQSSASTAPSEAKAGPQADCPFDLECTFVPAAKERFRPTDRPGNGLDLRYIVIHNTELSYDRTIKLFTNPDGITSAHYLLRSADGAVTQFVRNSDLAYHAGNFWFNMHSIGIEHEGFMAQGARWYTEEMYRASATLVRHLANKYGIPLDREHILGHDEIPATRADRVPQMHTDPGPYWNWEHYFTLLGAPLADDHADRSRMPGPSVVTLAPLFGWNTRPLQDCSASGCTELPAQGSNVVILRTEPRADAPLLGDRALRPDGSPGTLGIDDAAAKATTGQRFVVAERRNGWVAVWFGGQVGWFFDRTGAIGLPGNGSLVTPLPGRTTIPVYGIPVPEGTAYPVGVPPTQIEALPYSIPAGQFYVGLTQHHADDFTAPDASPDERVYVVGHRRLVEISFNHRRAFVDADDVLILN